MTLDATSRRYIFKGVRGLVSSAAPALCPPAAPGRFG